MSARLAGFLKDIPVLRHWAIITEDMLDVSTGWDSPSRRPVTEYRVYKTRESWVKEIQRREASDRPGDRMYRAIEVRPATVRRTVAVDVAPLDP